MRRCGSRCFVSRMNLIEQLNHESKHPVERYCCGEPMKVIRVIPRIGSYPELLTYRCEQCHNIETVEGT